MTKASSLRTPCPTARWTRPVIRITTRTHGDVTTRQTVYWNDNLFSNIPDESELLFIFFNDFIVV